MEKIDIILPTKNEKENILIIFELLKCENYRLIVVDDSDDNTYEIIYKYKNENKKNNIVLIKGNRTGLGGAYKLASNYIKGDRVVIMDTDLSHNPDDIKKFLQYDTDVVTGTRYGNRCIKFSKKNCDCCINNNLNKEIFFKGGSVWTFKRRFVSRVANNITSLILNRSTDFTGSFRLYKKEAFMKIIKNCKSNGFSFQMEAMAYAIKNNLSIEECPIMFMDRLYGKSNMNSNEILTFLISLFNLVIFYLCK